MAVKLVIEALEEPLSTSQYELDQSIITVGRSKSCHIELDHPEISRRHFIIKFMDNAYILFDEASRHGTIIDGVLLVAHQNYPIQSEHIIELPGFIIHLSCDGQKPKLERTTVVARKLLDELLQDEVVPRHCPRLVARNKELDFRFIEKKTSFVLGRLPHVDFSVAADGVAKEHVSFVRDLYGIRINPLPGHEVFVNGTPIIDPQILAHNSTIRVGSLEFLFKAKDDDDPDEKIGVEETESHLSLREEMPPSGLVSILTTLAHEQKTNKAAPSVIKVLDRFFVVAFFFVLVGASAMFFSLI